MGPHRRVFITNSQMLCVQNLLVIVEVKRLAGFSSSQGGNLQRPQKHEPLHMLSLYIFSHVLDTNERHFQPNHFGTTSLKATVPGVLHHCTGHRAPPTLQKRTRPLRWFCWPPWPRPGPDKFSDGPAPRTQVKWTQTTTCCRNPTLTTSFTWWYAYVFNPAVAPLRGARALRPSSPNLLPPSLTSMTVSLTRKASARACRVGIKQRPSRERNRV